MDDEFDYNSMRNYVKTNALALFSADKEKKRTAPTNNFFEDQQ